MPFDITPPTLKRLERSSKTAMASSASAAAFAASPALLASSSDWAVFILKISLSYFNVTLSLASSAALRSPDFLASSSISAI